MAPSAHLSRGAVLGLFALLLGACPPGGGDPPDATSSDVDASDGPVAGVLLGTQAQWKQPPDDFIALEDGSTLPIVMGHQGLWMVVLAIKSFETLSGELDLTARIAAANVVDELMLINRPLDPELDGHDYLYDIWLVVSDPSLATYDATVTVEITDETGLELVLERQVVLGGGDS